MLNYTQLAQVRLNTTAATGIYQCGAGEEVQLFIKACNVTEDVLEVSVYHDHNGATYDQSTAIAWQVPIPPGRVWEMEHVFVNNPSGSIAYRTSIANGITLTLYGVVKS